MAAARSHLSIGAVLSLLREEFPDITISKIRFLESQGLVDPERTPSGYRKFYEHDVDRLRWILRQQRENFLPLKVIKGRLSEQDPDAAEASEQLVWSEAGETAALPPAPPPPPDTLTPATLTDGTPLRGGTPPSGTSSPPTLGSPPPAARSLDTPPPTTAAPETVMPAAPHMGTPATPALDTSSPSGGPRVALAPARPGIPPAAQSATLAPAPPPAHADMDRAAAPSVVSPARPATSRAGSRTFDGEAPVLAPPGTSSLLPDGAARADGDVDSYSAADLALAAGVELADVDGLRSFGLLASHSGVGGSSYFDADALEVVRLAAAFARFGVEVRHLRAWKTGAEREASLFEQVVMPLMRQRNPNARRQALETLDELAGYGAALRDVLVRQSLRNVR